MKGDLYIDQGGCVYGSIIDDSNIGSSSAGGLGLVVEGMSLWREAS